MSASSAPTDTEPVIKGAPLPEQRRRAAAMLLLATVVWGLSFPLTKAFFHAQELILPGRSSWFHSSLLLVSRFSVATLLLMLVTPRLGRGITALEWKQGIGLGFFTAFGMLLQADGLAYTSASISAFLTQLYCVFIPLIVALHQFRIPPPRIVLSCVIVVAGVGILADVDWRTFRLGRGELETIISSLFFTAQILWLGRTGFRGNDARRTTLVMFATVAVLLIPGLIRETTEARDLSVSFASLTSLLLILAMTVFCTVLAFVWMNHWQRKIDATRAGLIYCAEPLFASLFALFLPAIVSHLAGLNYANERPTFNLLVGGGLITLANFLALQPGAAVEGAQLPAPERAP